MINDAFEDAGNFGSSISSGLSDLGSSLLGFGQGAISGLINNAIKWHFDKKKADYNFDMSEKAAENQYQRQLDFWHMQNDYNSPSSQVNRRLAAGLSPVEGVDSGNASSLSSVPGNQVALGGPLSANYEYDLLGEVQKLAQIDQLGKQGDLITEQTANLVQDLLLKDIESKLKDAGLKDAAEELERKRRENRREEQKDKYVFDENYFKNLGDYERAALLIGLSTMSNQANILQKDWDFYKKHGIKPDGIGPYEKMLLNQVDTGKLLSNPLEFLFGGFSDLLNSLVQFASKFGNRKKSIFEY